MEETIRRFKAHLAKLHAYEHALGVLYYDAETVMPKAGGEGLSRTIGVLSEESYKLSTAPEFKEMLAALLQKGVSGDPTCVNAYEALKMATVGGAKAQGREAEIGQIGEGFDADLILIDTDSPVLRPVYDPVSTTAYSATGRDVCLTMVQGRILYENGCFTTIDVEQAIREVEEYAVPIVRG